MEEEDVLQFLNRVGLEQYNQGIAEAINTALGLKANADSVYTKSEVDTALSNINQVVVGSIIMWPKNTAPDGYLLCDGNQIPADSKYSNLRELLGGSNPTTPNLTNLITGISFIIKY